MPQAGERDSQGYVAAAVSSEAGETPKQEDSHAYTPFHLDSRASHEADLDELYLSRLFGTLRLFPSLV